jgi:hypothetical protein
MGEPSIGRMMQCTCTILYMHIHRYLSKLLLL